MHALILLAGIQFASTSKEQALHQDAFKLQLSGREMKGTLAKLMTKTFTPPIEVKTKRPAAKAPSEPAAVEPSVAASSNETTSGTGNGKPGSAAFAMGSVSGTRIADLKTLYQAELRAKIDANKFYPPISRRLGQQGTVVVSFTLSADGSITDIKLESPSEFGPLNKSALDAVKRIGKFKAIPKDLEMDEMRLKIPIRFVTL